MSSGVYGGSDNPLGLRDDALEVEREAAKRYKIIRHFFNSNRKVVVKTNLTLALAQEHCRDPETSSSTCTKAEGKRRTRRFGPWFDGYTEMKGKRR